MLGALAALAYTLIRRLAEAGRPASRIVLWYSVAGAVVASVLIPFTPKSDYNTQTVIALGALTIVGLRADAPDAGVQQRTDNLAGGLQYCTVAFAAVCTAFCSGGYSAAACCGR